MTIRELLSWQWQGYPMYHRDRMNLLVHLAAVPVFMLANGLIIVAALRFAAVMLAGRVIALILAVALQARGHSRSESSQSASRAWRTLSGVSSSSSG